MSFPDGLQTVTVTTGPHLDITGAPLAGRKVRLTPEWKLEHEPSGAWLLPTAAVGVLDFNGMASIVVPASGAAGLKRTNVRYLVSYDLGAGIAAPAPFYVLLPAAAPTVDLEALVPVEGADGSTVALPTVTSLAGLSGAVTADQVAQALNGAGNRLSDLALRAAFGSAEHNTALRKWWAALANRYAAPARVLVMGDSISEGTGSTTFARRWQAVLQGELRGRFQPPGVVGATIPYVTASPRATPLPTGLGVTTAGSPTQASFGLGLRALTVGVGQSVTFTFTGDRCTLVGTKGSSAGRYNIVLDGGAGVVVDGFQSGNPVGGNVIWDSGALARGSHTVVVTRDASTTNSPGNVFPEGLLTYDGDHDLGVRVIDGARHGAVLATFTGSTAWTNAVTTIGSFGLLVMAWGANDSTSGTTAAAFQTGLSSLITQVRAAGFAGSILLVGLDKRQTADAALWQSYLDAMQAIADGDPDIAYADLRSRMPDVGTAEATALGLYFDDVHPNDKGHGYIADQIATAILPR